MKDLHEPTHSIAVYNSALLAEFRDPANTGEFPAEAENVGSGAAGSAAGGCLVRFQLQADASGRVRAARYRTYGCPVAIAACSYISTRLTGKTPAAVEQIELWPLLAELEPPAEKRGVVLCVEDALRAAARDLGRMASGGAAETVAAEGAMED